MRVGLDLRGHDAAASVRAAVEADRLGLWAVLVTAPAGAESAVAAEIAASTEHIHIAVQFDAGDMHPLGLAEEVSILDHLSARRAIAIVDSAPSEFVDHARQLLAGEIVNDVALTPPPAQTAVATWARASLATLALPDDLDRARTAIDAERNAGRPWVFVTWSGSLAVLARHLASRAIAPRFPDIVADYADVIAPLSTHEDEIPDRLIRSGERRGKPSR